MTCNTLLLSVAASVGLLIPAAPAQTAPWTVIGWRVGIASTTYPQTFFFDAVDRAAAVGAKFMEGDSRQRVSAEIPGKLDSGLSDADIAAIRQKLRAAGVAMTVYYVPDLPEGESARDVFTFAKRARR